MKVVLFCGGLGTRLREHSETIPKPLVTIGYRPILWHLMRYYAHFGHREFILCLGYRADLVREYFLDYNPARYVDVRIEEGGEQIEFLEDQVGWSVSLVDTGVNASVGERLKAVAPYLEGEDMFLANYSDGLSDLPLPTYIEEFRSSDAVGSFLCVKPSQTFHPVDVDDDGVVADIRSVHDADIWINGGFFAFRPEIFDYLHAGEELVEEPFQRMIAQRRLRAHRYHGFWAAMDTLRDKVAFDEMEANQTAPWMVWKP
jgi:glucose-1-phosphate cytidylyltransferase